MRIIRGSLTPPSSRPMKENLNCWMVTIWDAVGRSRNLILTCQEECSAGPSGRPGKTRSGTFANGCARTVPDVAAAVRESAAAARKPGTRLEQNGLTDIVTVPLVAVFAPWARMAQL